MTRVSRRVLDQNIETLLYETFWRILEQCEQRGELQFFLKDLLTEAELVVLSKRIAVALMLEAGHSYAEIEQVLKVSPPTIAKVKEWMREKWEALAPVLEQSGEEHVVRRFLYEVKRSLGQVDKPREWLAGEARGKVEFVQQGNKWVRDSND